MNQRNQETQVLDEKFKQELIEKLDELRKSNLLCDTTLRAEEQDFAAHRCVLSAGSPYFRALFTSQLNVQENENNLIELKEITSDALTEVLKYVYTGEAKINSSNAEDLVVAADYLMIESLKSKASLFLEESIDVSNCLALESFASRYNCESLKQAAVTFTRQHFVAVATSSDFQSLDVQKLEELLSDDKINVAREEDVYEAAVRWVKHDLASRECSLPELLKCVRLFSMSKYALRQILDEEELVKNSLPCMKTIVSGMDYFLFPDRYQNISLKPRLSLGEYEDVVILSGGMNANNEKSSGTHFFVLSTKKWIKSQLSMPQSCSNHGAAVCGGILYVIDGSSHHVRVYSFDPKQMKWNSTEHKTGKHNYFKDCSVTTFNEELYVIGGNENFYKIVRVYNPVLNEWKEVAPMKTGRAGHCAVVLQKHIYAIAGYYQSVCHKSVECYNPSTDQWQEIPSLSKARRFAAAAVSNGKIIVVGGFSAMAPSQTIESSCEMFNPSTTEWSLVSSPAIPRAACGIVSFDDMIYLFGGRHEGHLMKTVERFDVKRNEWRDIAVMPIVQQCSFLKASLLRLPKRFLL